MPMPRASGGSACVESFATVRPASSMRPEEAARSPAAIRRRGGLAAAGRTEEGDHLARCDGQVNAPEDFAVPKLLADTLRGQSRLAGQRIHYRVFHAIAITMGDDMQMTVRCGITAGQMMVPTP